MITSGLLRFTEPPLPLYALIDEPLIPPLIKNCFYILGLGLFYGFSLPPAMTLTFFMRILITLTFPKQANHP